MVVAAVVEQMHNSDKHSNAGSEVCTGSHYALAVEPAGIVRCHKNIQDIVGTFDMTRGSEDDASAAVGCRQCEKVMLVLAEEVDREIPRHSCDQLTKKKLH